MAPIRHRGFDKPNTVAQKEESVITPNEEVILKNDNQYESILQMVQDLQEQNKLLAKKVAEANGDISEQIKDAKKKYGFFMDGTRNPDEPFKYKFKTLISDRKEKVVISSETIGRPVHYMNSNTGKWTNEHIVEIIFHDGTKEEMDVLDYLNQMVSIEHTVPDKDIETINGEKHYTFRTEKFGTFTINQKFIG